MEVQGFRRYFHSVPLPGFLYWNLCTGVGWLHLHPAHKLGRKAQMAAFSKALPISIAFPLPSGCLEKAEHNFGPGLADVTLRARTSKSLSIPRPTHKTQAQKSFHLPPFPGTVTSMSPVRISQSPPGTEGSCSKRCCWRIMPAQGEGWLHNQAPPM